MYWSGVRVCVSVRRCCCFLGIIIVVVVHFTGIVNGCELARGS